MNIVSCIAAAALLLAVGLHALPARAANENWGYTGEEGPENWHRLDPAFKICKEGRNQAPINLVPGFDVDLPPLEAAYSVEGSNVVHNGHSIQVDFPAGNILRVAGREFALQQVHFHAPSENRLNGTAYPFEAHFVHQDAEGNAAVLAVFYAEGKENPAIAELWKDMPEEKGEIRSLPGGFAPQSILPEGRDYVYFNGSLTTPPCTEGVRWYVLKEAGSISRGQVDAFLRALRFPNSRPVQPVNARVVID